MKFSYQLIKQLVPGVPAKKRLIEQLHLKSFETKDGGGDILNIEVPHNRYSDASSHLGVAREAAAIFKLKVKKPRGITFPKNKGLAKVEVSAGGGSASGGKNTNLCPRYAVLYCEIDKVGRTPDWMKKVLVNCGLQLINPVVDIMNYVMLEVGQPLHAFDADKIESGLVVRLAKKGEKITTLDNQHFALDKEILVIADSKRVLAIAGVKGGKYAEVDRKTRRIVVEAANFDRVNIYQTSRKLGLTTDASSRFGHGISPALVEVGLGRAAALLQELLGARVLDSVDVNKAKASREIIGFSVEKFNSLIGLNLDKKAITSYLIRLGFKTLPSLKANKVFDFLVEVPEERTDITIFEDLVEEVARLYDYNKIKPQPPLIALTPATEEDLIKIKDNTRKILAGFGFSEVYNYSFASAGGVKAYELENPIAIDKRYLRTNLGDELQENAKRNSKSFSEVRIFEIGKVFQKPREKTHLGILYWSKRGVPFLEIKGTIEKLLYRLGLVEFLFKPTKTGVELAVDRTVLGKIENPDRRSAVAEINLDKLANLIEEEYEFRPLPKYPAVMRDLSLEMKGPVQVGDILNAIESASVKDVRDVDLIDYYDPRRFTFRIIFQSAKKTLTDKEVNKEMETIVKVLKRKFRLRIR